jgi:hypothetical protein
LAEDLWETDLNAHVSFVTTVAGRLAHLQETLPANLDAAGGLSGRVDFLLLNYDADPAFRRWAEENASTIGLGSLTHYFELLQPRPSRWHASYAKNVIHLLCQKEFVCNLDADNFLSSSFVREVVTGFDARDDVFFTLAHLHAKGVWGRIAVSKRAFCEVGGYDEAYLGWGYEDVDLVERLCRAGSVQVPILSSDTAIEHDDSLRESKCPMGMSESRPQNARRLLQNRRAAVVATNNEGWGRAKVEKNFGEILITAPPAAHRKAR